MITLNEYLGTLVSDLSRARVLADLESAKIAEAYASNDLLRYFPVPCMKFDTVELTIPVAVDKIEIETGKAAGPVNWNKFKEITYSEILVSFGKRSLPAETSKNLRSEISKYAKKLESKINRINADNELRGYSLNIAALAEKTHDLLAKTKTGNIKTKDEKKIFPEKLAETLAQKLKEEIKFDRDKKELLNLNVTVESNMLKERDPSTLVIIKMKVTEEGMNWERVDSGDGKIVSKLMPA